VTRVAVIGASGRLGRFACEVFEKEPGFDLVARLGRADDLNAALARAGPEVALDVTHAGLGLSHGLLLLALGIRPLIGTSGVSLEDNRRLDETARERGLGGLVVPNFSLGMCLLQRAANEAARLYAKAEIIEMHHDRKKDAPSGTALDTAERMRVARGQHASPGDIPIHSVRLPGLYAHQVVMFGGAGESYTLRHDMHGPEGFSAGLQAGVRYAARAAGVGRGIALAFEALDAG
jgi:4-hydroxy-tetrahydrodipicolinate reductase